MLLSQKYYSFLVSTIPNNHCELCSHFDIESEVSIAVRIKLNRTWDICPSCGRTVKQYFISEKESILPKVVPDDYITKPDGRKEKILERGHPIQPRSCYDPTYWENYDWSTREAIPNQYSPKEEPNFTIKRLDEMKPIKVRLKLGKVQ